MNLHEIRTRACLVEAQEELDTFLVAFADDMEEPQDVLELQRALPGSELAEQDAGTEMDTYCLVWNAGATHYGGVFSCVLRETELTLMLEPEAREVFGVSGFRLLFEIGEDELNVLRRGLEILFEDRRSQEWMLR